MKETFEIREAQEGDYDCVRALLTAENGEFLPEDDFRHPKNEAQAIIDASQDPQSKTRCWLAISNGRAAGIITTHDLSGGVYVDDDFRGMGIGSTLASARNDFYKQIGKTEAKASILASNTKSINMHQKLGYRFNEASQQLIDKATKKGIDPATLKDDCGNVPVLTMTKSL